MKILVTGAAGFIGSHLCEALLSGGNQVVGLDNFDTFYDPGLKRMNIELSSTNNSFRFVEGDILNSKFLDVIFAEEQFDLVIHLAAKAGVRPSIIDPVSYQRVNVEGTLNILEHLRQNKVSKFIFASSSSVYGNNKKIPYSETDAVDFTISPYAATKKAGEVLAYTYHHLYGIHTTCLRFFTVYGPRQRPEMAIRSFTDKIISGNPLILFGNGQSLRDYTFIDDIIHGILASIKHLNGYEILNLGESHTTSLIDLVRFLERALNKKAIIEYRPMQPGDVDQTFADIRKAQELIGYSPKTKIEDGIRRFVQWYVTSGLQKTHSSIIP